MIERFIAVVLNAVDAYKTGVTCLKISNQIQNTVMNAKQCDICHKRGVIDKGKVCLGGRDGCGESPYNLVITVHMTYQSSYE